jgi:hypothetical protein
VIFMDENLQPVIQRKFFKLDHNYSLEKNSKLTTS